MIIQNITRIVKNACGQKTNLFGPEIWDNHIVKVIHYGNQLARERGADQEIVELAALLHDYSGIKDFKMYENHHIYSALSAEKLLARYGYPQDRIRQIQHCILTHRGSRPLKRRTKAAQCLADADSIAHFNAVPSLMNLAVNTLNVQKKEANLWVAKKLTQSWNKLSDETQQLMKHTYETNKIMLAGTA